MNAITGKNVVIFIQDGADWKPYACAISCTLNIATEVIETSEKGAGLFATFKPTKNSFSGSISGITHISVANMFDLQELRNKQMTHQILNLRFDREADDLKIYRSSGNFYITNSSDDGTLENMNTFTIDMQGTGPLTETIIP